MKPNATIRRAMDHLITSTSRENESKHQKRVSWWCATSGPEQRDAFMDAAHLRAEQRNWSHVAPFAREIRQ